MFMLIFVLWKPLPSYSELSLFPNFSQGPTAITSKKLGNVCL